MWDKLRRKGIEGYRFRRQQVVGGYVADFYCHQARLAIEIDGDTRRPDYDRTRDEVFRRMGVKTLRFANSEVVHNADGVVEAMRQYLSGKDLPPSPS